MFAVLNSVRQDNVSEPREAIPIIAYEVVVAAVLGDENCRIRPQLREPLHCVLHATMRGYATDSEVRVGDRQS